MSDLHRQASPPRHFRARYLVVDAGKGLGGRIAARVDDMLRAGWVEEAGALAAIVPPGAPAWNATGYAVVRRVATGELDVGAARERIVIETRQYAKRQLTWFRHQLPPDRVVALDTEQAGWERAATQWYVRGLED